MHFQREVQAPTLSTALTTGIETLLDKGAKGADAMEITKKMFNAVYVNNPLKGLVKAAGRAAAGAATGAGIIMKTVGADPSTAMDMVNRMFQATKQSPNQAIDIFQKIVKTAGIQDPYQAMQIANQLFKTAQKDPIQAVNQLLKSTGVHDVAMAAAKTIPVAGVISNAAAAVNEVKKGTKAIAARVEGRVGAALLHAIQSNQQNPNVITPVTGLNPHFNDPNEMMMPGHFPPALRIPIGLHQLPMVIPHGMYSQHIPVNINIVMEKSKRKTFAPLEIPTTAPMSKKRLRKLRKAEAAAIRQAHQGAQFESAMGSNSQEAFDDYHPDQGGHIEMRSVPIVVHLPAGRGPKEQRGGRKKRKGRGGPR